MEEKIVFNTEDVNGNKVFGILAYIGIFSVASLGLLAVPISIVLNLVVWAFNLGFMILGIVNACSGEAKVLPVIGKITILR